MTDQQKRACPDLTDPPIADERRQFLHSLGKWSQAVIGGVLLGSTLVESPQVNAAVVARGYGGSAAVGARGGWVNRYGGGGWANRAGGGGWINGGGGWINGGGGGWINGGGGWINRYGGGGAWFNRR